MAQRKKPKAKGKAKATRTKRPTAKKPSRRPARKAAPAANPGGAKLAALEAENQRLRAEIADLRGRLEQQERAVPAFNLSSEAAETES